MPGDTTPGRTRKETDTGRRSFATGMGGTPGGTRKRPPIDLGRLAEHAELIERIGRGGYGEVWRVRYLGSEEVWKFIPVTTTEDNQALKEAIHARRVDHRNVVKVHDIIRQGSHHILRMDLVRGRDLYRVVNEEGVLPPDQAIAFMTQVASALKRAHDQGVVHLDLKPHNLLLRDDGSTVMVTDFGISASLVRDLATEEVGGRGTPYFLAPEQALAGQKVGSAADIWSFGVTLYYLLSRHYPFDFDGKDAAKVIAESSPTPLSRRIPWSWEELDALLERCLKKAPLERFASMTDVSTALEGLLGRIRCPGCGQECPIDAASQHCPVASCQSPDLIRTRDATLAMRSGDRGFALGLFTEGEESYRKVHGAPQSAEAERKLKLMSSWQEDHKRQVAAVRASLEAGQLLDAFQAVREALVSHSRSRELRELERKLATLMVERYQTARERVEGLLRQANFVEARKYLTLIDAMLSYVPARDLLLGDRDDEQGTPTGFSAMYATIEEREHVHEKLGRDINAAIAALNFVEARNLLDRIQSMFPSPQNLERMRQLALSSEAMRVLEGYPPALLERLAAGSQELPANRNLELVKAQQLCSELLRAHTPETFPRMQEIAELRGRIEGAIKVMGSAAEHALEAGSHLLEESHPERARATLESVRDIFLRADLFSEQKRDDFRRLLVLATERASRTEELYKEACRSEELRQFSKALMIFEEVQRLDPDRYLDLLKHVATCQEKAALRLRMVEESRPLFVQLTTEEPRDEVLERFLDLSGQFDELQDDSARMIAQQELAEVLSHYLAVAQRRITAADAASKLYEVERVLATLGHLRDDHWQEVLPRYRSLAQRVIEFGHKIAEIPNSLGSREGLDYLEQAVHATESFRSALRSLPSTDQVHPCLVFAETARHLVERSKGASRIEIGRRAAALLQTIEPFCPRTILDQLEDARASINRIAQRSAVLVRGGRVARAVLRQALPISAAVIFFIVGVTLAHHQESTRRASTIARAMERLLGKSDLSLDGSFEKAIAPSWWFSPRGSSDEADRVYAGVTATLTDIEKTLAKEDAGGFERSAGTLGRALGKLAALPVIRDASQHDLGSELRQRVAAAIATLFKDQLRALTSGPFTFSTGSGGDDQLALVVAGLAASERWIHGLAAPGGDVDEIKATLAALQEIDRHSLDVSRWIQGWDGKSQIPASVTRSLAECVKQHTALQSIEASFDLWISCLEADRIQRALRRQLSLMSVSDAEAAAFEEGLWLVVDRLAELVRSSNVHWQADASQDAVLRALALLAPATNP